MAIIAFASAKGSPGVTSLVVGLARQWSHVLPGRSAIAVDMDPVGGDFAAGVLAGVVHQDAGLIAVATSRGIPPMASVEAASVMLDGHPQAWLLPGVPDGSRSGALALAWEVLEGAESDRVDRRIDLLVDAGRVDLSRPVPPWIASADRVVLVSRPSLSAATAAHRWSATWADSARGVAAPLSMILVDAPSPYSSAEVEEAVGVPCIGSVPFDVVNVRVNSEGVGPSRAFARSPYSRALAGIVGRLGRLVAVDPAPTGSAEPEATVPLQGASRGAFLRSWQPRVRRGWL